MKQKVIKETENNPELHNIIGSVVSFPENEIRYYQDHRFLVGMPTGVEFTIKGKSTHGDYRLVADGYGNIEKPNCYGSGSLYINEKDIEWALAHLTDEGVRSFNRMEDLKEVEIEQLRQLISRTDKSGNEKLLLLMDFIYTREQSSTTPNAINSVKCSNCDEMVVMVSKGVFCPSCYC